MFIFQLQELIQLFGMGPTKYFSEVYNLIDVLLHVSILFFVIQHTQLTEEVSLEVETINMALILSQSFIKFLYYLRVFPALGQIIRLSYDVFYAARSFSVFFYLYILLFSFQYTILKVVISGHPDKGFGHGTGNDYERLSKFLGFFLYAFRNSIGDLQVPNAEYWEKSPVMVYIIWIVWMFHLYFMLIVFLNFLIAIISQVYEQDLVMSLQNEYTQKAQMNLEIEYFLKFWGYQSRHDFYILAGAVEDKIEKPDQQELSGIVLKIK